jgi:hypothetical protein
MASQESNATTKTCTKCGETKSIEAFRLHRSSCRQCELDAVKHWYAAHKEEKRAYDRAYQETHREERRAKGRAYNKEHYVERRGQYRSYREAHKEERRIYNRIYQQEHRSEIALRMRTYKASHRVQQANLQRNRAAKKKALPDTFTHEQEQFCRQYFHYTCVYCGKEEGFLWCVAMDHFIPLDSPLCPGTVITNMLPACSGQDGCNISKKNREPHAWLIRKFGKRKATAILRKIEAYFAVVRVRFP